MFKRENLNKFLPIAFLSLLSTSGCMIPKVAQRNANTQTPPVYSDTLQTANNSATIKWREFFNDPFLVALIDTALSNNQELNITVQEIEISRQEIRARKGEYLPFVGVQGGIGGDKVGRYTNTGAFEDATPLAPGRVRPEFVPNYLIATYATWEVDIWRKLRNAKKAAYKRYLASVAGRNFLVTNLVAEIANTYYELLALDNQLAIVNQNIQIQSDALEIVRLQKQAARVTELAVRRFEAQVLHTQSLQYDIRQNITEMENRLNFLIGRFPQPVARQTGNFENIVPQQIFAGMPAQLLANRPDIQQREQDLAAANLDVKVAKARFYPSLTLNAGVGFQAFNPAYLVQAPTSLLFSLAGDLVAPIINRNGIKASYYSANARQVQAVYNYELTILNAYMEVVNQLSKIQNLQKSYGLKSLQVDALNQSVNISNALFRNARADYMEVLLTQRDALESKFELIDTKKEQLNAMVNVYQALGGGWR